MAPHWGPDGACPGPAGMLLLVGLPASPADYAARLGGGRSLATVRLLHDDHFMEDRCLDLHSEDLGPEFGCSHLPPVQVDDVDRGHESQSPLGGLLRLLNGNQAATGAWDGSAHEEEVLFRPHVDNLERLGGHPHAPHVPWQPLVLPDPRGVRTAPDRAWRAVEHRPMRFRTAREMMPLHHALEPFSLGDPHDVHQLAFGKHAHRDGRADLRLARGTEFTRMPVRRQIGLGEVPLDRLRRFPVWQFPERQLDSGIPVTLLRLDLRHAAGASLDHRDGHRLSTLEEHLGHSELLPQQPVGHSLISTSTPAARLSFIRASIVSGVGSMISMSRLYVRISNCSRDFLSAWVERCTVHLLMRVGNGIGPTTLAPVRLTVSTISATDWSRTR